MLMYLDPTKTFHVYSDASSKFAMGAVLVQDGKVISTFSRKLNNAHLKYTVTDQELLAILEACKHFKQIIHGCVITVHTDHKNLTFNTAQRSNARVERSLIQLQEEFEVKLKHIPGEENTAADGLSRLSFDKNLVVNNTIFATQAIDEEDSHMFPLDMHHIGKKQLTDKPLQQKLKDPKLAEYFGWMQFNNVDLITFKEKVWVPVDLQMRLIYWSHETLGHAVSTRTINSIGHSFGFPGLRSKVEDLIRSCDTCQRHKKSNKKAYGKLPLVSALHNKMPWECIHVDSIEPWTVTVKDPVTICKYEMEIHGLTMVDACTQWADATVLLNSTAKRAAKKFNQVWLCSKPRPRFVVHNNGTEFTGAEFQEMLSSYNIKAKQTTVKNPTANSLAKRISSTFEDQLQTKIFGINYIGEVNYLLQIALFAIRTVMPSNCAFSPSQLAYRVDMFFCQQIHIDWLALKAKRQKQSMANNEKENKK